MSEQDSSSTPTTSDEMANRDVEPQTDAQDANLSGSPSPMSTSEQPKQKEKKKGRERPKKVSESEEENKVSLEETSGGPSGSKESLEKSEGNEKKSQDEPTYEKNNNGKSRKTSKSETESVENVENDGINIAINWKDLNVDGKRKLVIALVKGNGTKKPDWGDEQNKPGWWPSDVPFSDPRHRSDRPTGDMLDRIISAAVADGDGCIHFLENIENDGINIAINWKDLNKVGKRKLMIALVNQNVTKKPNWGDKGHKPCWWPSDVPFSDPSHGSDGLTVDMLDKIISAVADGGCDGYMHFQSTSKDKEQEKKKKGKKNARKVSRNEEESKESSEESSGNSSGGEESSEGSEGDEKKSEACLKCTFRGNGLLIAQFLELPHRRVKYFGVEPIYKKYIKSKSKKTSESKSGSDDKDSKDSPTCSTCGIELEKCSKEGVIYLITCKCCEDDKEYIGQTGRSLHTRFKEHIRSAKFTSKPFAEHYSVCHQGKKPEMTVEILKEEKDPKERKKKEAQLIKERKPKLNTMHNK